MICKKCGAEIADDAVFCTNCGEKIAQRRCPSCGSELAEDSKFCVFCGTKAEQGSAEPTEVQKEESPFVAEEKKPKTAKAALIAAGVLAAVVVLFLVFGGAQWLQQKRDEAVVKKAISEALAEMDDMDEEDFLYLDEDFDDYLGSWVAYITDTETVQFNIRKEKGKYWLTIDASAGTKAPCAYTELTLIDEDIGVAIGENDDTDCYLDAYLDFVDGWMSLSVSMLDKGLNYSLDFEDAECYMLTEEDMALYQDASVYDEYVIPDSDSVYLRKSDLQGLSKEELKIARNEIYARHGRMFQDDSLQAYFNSCSWYTPSIAPEDFKESMLNAVEIANRDLIVSYEKEMGYR